MSIIEIQGRASKKSFLVDYSENELDKDLLSWLREKGFAIASSCNGEGICRKCIIQNDLLTCQVTLREFLRLNYKNIIIIDYL